MAISAGVPIWIDYLGGSLTPRFGRKNMPVDDMANLLHYYNLLADCARSSVRVMEKFENFKYRVKTVRGFSRRDRRRVTKAKELIYTDPGSQTMCHFRCVISKWIRKDIDCFARETIGLKEVLRCSFYIKLSYNEVTTDISSFGFRIHWRCVYA